MKYEISLPHMSHKNGLSKFSTDNFVPFFSYLKMKRVFIHMLRKTRHGLQLFRERK